MINDRRPAATALALVLGLAIGLAGDPARAATATAPWSSPSAAQFAGESARDRIKRLVVLEAERAGVPPALALALAKVSSDFQPLARSTRGAVGVLQIMPGTAERDLGVTVEELKEPRLNIEVGLDRLRRFHDHLGDWEQAMAAYHAGLDADRLRPMPTSRVFVDAVLDWAERYEAQARLWTRLAAAEREWEPPLGPAVRPAWPHVRIVSRTRPAVAAPAGDFVDIEARRRQAQWRLDDFGPRTDARGPVSRGPAWSGW